MSDANVERRLSVYEILFTKAFSFEAKSEAEIAAEVEAGKTEDPATGMPIKPSRTSVLKRVVADPGLQAVYDHVMQMREAIVMCRHTFAFYADQHRAKLNDHLSLVEKQQLDEKIMRNQGIADVLKRFLDPMPQPDEWLPITTAPQDSSTIRVLGRKTNGQPYVETTWWHNIGWAISEQNGYLPPTHWKPMEAIPDGY